MYYYKYVGNRPGIKNFCIKYFGNKIRIIKSDFDMMRKYFFIGNNFTNQMVHYCYVKGYSYTKNFSDVLAPYSEEEDYKKFRVLYKEGDNFIRGKSLDYDPIYDKSLKKSLIINLFRNGEISRERVNPDNIIVGLREGHGLKDKKGRRLSILNIREGFEMGGEDSEIVYKENLAYYTCSYKGKKVIISNKDIKEVL
jgi:hypothetical protein